jgi:pyruvate,orthophosphate dikinase
MATESIVVKALGASPGVATGEIVFRSEDAVALASLGRAVILVRTDTTAEDLPGIRAAAGIVTTRGGVTGDAAIIARSLGKPCIGVCSALSVDYAGERLVVRLDGGFGAPDRVLSKGQVITIDGSRGEIRVA